MSEPIHTTTAAARPRVVIIGGGFGGLSAAHALAKVPVDVTLIDRHNYHLFQPLLYQVATAGLAPNAIAAPIRAILRRQANATVLMETVTGIDAAQRLVLIGEERPPYDFLVIAAGARHAYFGHDKWEPFAPGIKTLADALTIRQHVLGVRSNGNLKRAKRAPAAAQFRPGRSRPDRCGTRRRHCRAGKGVPGSRF